jgi:isopentenyldiphosphate isomerase
MPYPPVVIVDEHDVVIGEAPLPEAWAKGLIHRTVLIVLENREGQVLLQRRAADMRLYPDCWDASAGGHVDNGNSYARAAQLEIEEELGVTVPIDDLEEVTTFYSEAPYPDVHTPRRFVRIYKAQIEALPATLDAREVSAVQWFTVPEIKALITVHPDEVAVGLMAIYEHVFAGKRIAAI